MPLELDIFNQTADKKAQKGFTVYPPVRPFNFVEDRMAITTEDARKTKESVKSIRKDLQSFFTDKTIQRPYLFRVSMASEIDMQNHYSLPNMVEDKGVGVPSALLEKFAEYTNKFNPTNTENKKTPTAFEIPPYSVKTINIPNFSFTKEITNIGPFSKMVPVMQFDGYEVTIEFSESMDLKIAKMCNWFRARNICDDGWFWPAALSEYPNITVELIRPDDEPVAIYEFKGLHFLTATEPSLTYSGSDPISYSVTFNCSSINIKYAE